MTSLGTGQERSSEEREEGGSSGLLLSTTSNYTGQAESFSDNTAGGNTWAEQYKSKWSLLGVFCLLLCPRVSESLFSIGTKGGFRSYRREAVAACKKSLDTRAACQGWEELAAVQILDTRPEHNTVEKNRGQWYRWNMKAAMESWSCIGEGGAAKSHQELRFKCWKARMKMRLWEGRDASRE